MAVIAMKAKDKASGQLNAGINASVLSIPLKTSEGANFPQPYTGTGSSAGSSTVLNDTGDLGNLAVGDFVRNVTDGSWAFVVTAGTNSVTTTQLRGGTDNTWDSGDTWRVNEFVATLAKINGSGVDTQYEEVLISNRSTDTLTVPTGGRGYNSTTAKSFDADDYVQLRVTAPYHDEIKMLLKEFKQQADTSTTDITTANTNITNLQTGAYHYVVTTGSADAYVAATPALAAYAAGNLIVMKANFTNTGAATINLNSLGAKSIKKNDGATALAAGDIISGQIVVLRYDGTNMQMLSPIGTPATITTTYKTVYCSAASSSGQGASTDSAFDFDTHSYTVPANDFVVGVAYEFEAQLALTFNASYAFRLYARIGNSDGATATFTSGSGGTKIVLIKCRFFGTAAAGASVAVNTDLVFTAGANGADGIASGSGASAPSVATNGTLALEIAGAFLTAHASNSAVMKNAVIRKLSSTAFAQ